MRVLAGSARRHHVPGTPKGSSGRKPQQRDVRGLATGLLSACCREIAVNVDAGNSGGPYMTVSAVWTIADIFNGLMALPNMIALFALSGVVVRETKAFFKKQS